MNGEHSPSMPLNRGEKMTSVDAQTGDLKWNISGWYAGNQLVIADGYLVAPNAYDNQIYCFGKGPTETTITASPSVAAQGAIVLIAGTVTDQSPAQKGSPAIADADMAAWMEYLNMQYPCPENANGVPVKLQAIAPDGNTIDIATVTSDANGYYQTHWTVPDQQNYRIVATFEGSESYFRCSQRHSSRRSRIKWKQRRQHKHQHKYNNGQPRTVHTYSYSSNHRSHNFSCNIHTTKIINGK